GAGSLSHSSGIWEENSVLSFDVSALSGLYSSIDSITLRLTISKIDDNNGNTTYVDITNNIYAVSAANRDWDEGAATWNNKAAATPWAGSAGLATAGTDYVNTLLASHTFLSVSAPTNGTTIDFGFGGDLTGLIDGWLVDNVDNSQSNPGLLISDPSFRTDAKLRTVYHSTEATNSDFHPELIVTYTPVPEPSSMLLLGLGGLALLRRRR
ncbi:DNRLRE domain-containing protein, partial [Haloferula sp.]|uniref:DNRLRE domain-containing protein n=1 Tax=Haloferula sp. TaxID=2497595 RepID=UPI003C708719